MRLVGAAGSLPAVQAEAVVRMVVVTAEGAMAAAMAASVMAATMVVVRLEVASSVAVRGVTVVMPAGDQAALVVAVIAVAVMAVAILVAMAVPVAVPMTAVAVVGWRMWAPQMLRYPSR